MIHAAKLDRWPARPLAFWLAAVSTCLALLADPPPARAQAVLNVAVGANDEASEQQGAFLLPAQPPEIHEAFEDFLRLSRRATWSKAFAALDKVTASQATGLVAGKNGLALPAERIVQQTLASLPAPGKEAYRLFHDAEAKTALDAASGLSDQAKQQLAKVARQFLFTASGDTAADQLGDYCFEAGDFDEAAHAWTSLLHFRPESRLPPARTIAKLATSLVRGGRFEDFARLREQYADRYGDEQVEFGGRKSRLREYLAGLAPIAPTRAAAAGPDDLPLPASGSAAPRWQFRLYKKAEASKLSVSGRRQVVVNGFLVQANQQIHVSSCVADGRVFLNLLGCHFALDAQSGKLLWRNGKFYELMRNLSSGNVFMPDRNRLVAAGDTLWSTAKGADQSANPSAPFQLYAYDAATGKERISPATAPDMVNWSMFGQPYITPEAIYITATKASAGTELHLLSLAPQTGAVRWNALLGNYKTDPNQDPYGGVNVTLPELVLHAQKIYVDNQVGAVLCVDARSGALEWAAGYEALPPPTNRWGWYNSMPKPSFTGPPFLRDGKLFVKGGKSTRLLSIDLDAPSVLWKRSIDESSRLIEVDAQRAYLTGTELMAVDLASHKLAWAHRLPQGTTRVVPLVTQNRIYQFTPRGIYEIEKQTGKLAQLFRGADLESNGGALHLADQTLIAVSNLGVTAYGLSAPAAAPLQQSADAARQTPAP